MKLLIILCCLFLCILQSCTRKIDLKTNDLKLIWYPSNENDKIEDAIIGLQWTYSYLGASLPLKKEGIIKNETQLLVNLSKLGFSSTSTRILNKLHQEIKSSGEYQKKGTIDLGRYVSLLLGSSDHYYAIVGQSKNLNHLLKKYQLGEKKMLITNSGVSKVNREILFSENKKGRSQLFIAKEINQVSKKIEEFETIELMPNGQLKFGIYDEDSTLIQGAKKHVTNAGKPAKCMWCHESNIQPIYKKQMTMSGYMLPSEVKNYLDKFKIQHNSYKSIVSSKSHLKYQNQFDHSKAELLYISFMEPSAKRLSIEWGINEQEVKKILKNEKTHFHFEFHFLGELYNRSEIEKYAPFKSVSVSPLVRELSKEEINYLK